jgi:hypothetical protein
LKDTGNHLVQQLPLADRQQLIASCQMAELDFSSILFESEVRNRYAYFPVKAFASLIAFVHDKSGVEVGMVGKEGMLGAHLALGVQVAPLQALVQGTGSAWRIEARALQGLLLGSTALRAVMSRYLYVLMAQLASSSVCLRFHHIEQRLARWLLMCQDRAQMDTFRLTHEFLAYMLGVRRVSITTAAGALQRRSLISYRRGELSVLDRGGWRPQHVIATPMRKRFTRDGCEISLRLFQRSEPSQGRGLQSGASGPQCRTDPPQVAGQAFRRGCPGA